MQTDATSGEFLDASRVDGACDAGFAAVRDAFRSIFDDLGEVGAGVCVFVDGEKRVDLWGGHAGRDRERAWKRDTLVNAYSVGKGVTAMLVLRLVERGVLDLDAPVARLWPELASEGKQALSLRMLLAHRGGLPAVRKRLPEGAMLDWEAMTRALAGQRPYWEPGRAHGYHVNTFGFLVGELARRATGSDFRDLLRAELTGPLEADFHVGLPASEHSRVSAICGGGAEGVDPERAAAAFPKTGDPEHDAMIERVYLNPQGLSGMGAVNTAAWREASIPSTNGHGTARAVAELYSAFLSGAAGVGPGLRREARSIASDGEDLVLRKPSRFGLGFQLAQPTRPLGPCADAFGHYGYGGSLGFADPDAQVAFGYLTNRPGERWQNPRTRRLIDAVYDCV